MIHKYSLNNYHILLDVNSGAVHVIDALADRLLDLFAPPLSQTCPRHVLDSLVPEGYPETQIMEAYEELYALYREGLLFSEDSYQDYAEQLKPAPIKSMCLNVAHDCNLRCRYCFAAQGDFGHGRKLMPFSVGKSAIDYMIAHSGPRRNLELDFFGGEPLMNWEVVRQLVTYARGLEQQAGKNFRFTLTTNGLLLDDERIAFINKEMSNVVLSIDGRKAVNDHLRPRADGTGCYDRIVPCYQKLAADRGGKNYYVRGTFTGYNLDFAQDVRHLLELGFRQISIEPVIGDIAEPYALTEADLPRIFEEYERLALDIIYRKSRGEEFNFFHFMLDLDQGPCAIKRLRGCSCGNEYIAVTPEGDIYPCHQFVGMEEWKLGTVLAGDLDAEKKLLFSKTHIYNKPDCRNCWAKFYCSGGCNANNYQYNGDIKKPHTLSCELERKRLECAIMIQAALC